MLPLINFVVRMTKCTLRASASATDTSPAKTARQKVRAHSPDNPRCATAHARTAPTVHTAQQRKDSKRAASRRGSAAQPVNHPLSSRAPGPGPGHRLRDQHPPAPLEGPRGKRGAGVDRALRGDA